MFLRHNSFTSRALEFFTNVGSFRKETPKTFRTSLIFFAGFIFKVVIKTSGPEKFSVAHVTLNFVDSFYTRRCLMTGKTGFLALVVIVIREIAILAKICCAKGPIQVWNHAIVTFVINKVQTFSYIWSFKEHVLFSRFCCIKHVNHNLVVYKKLLKFLNLWESATFFWDFDSGITQQLLH